MSSPLEPAEQRTLLGLARASIQDSLGRKGTLERAVAEAELTSRLGENRATFVTLKTRAPQEPAPPPDAEASRLRGCVGNLTPRDALYRSVIDNAAKSALKDPRFPPVEADELASLVIDISVLTPVTPVPGPEAIVIGLHGVRLEKEGRSAVFLPQVAVEQRWDASQLLEHLSRKAGLPRHGWRGAALGVFEADVFGEE